MNADDFALTTGVNRAILSLNQRGKLTSTTLMAMADASAEAASLALSSPNLGVGCHVVLVDGTPALPARQLPTLVDPTTGRFRTTLGKFVKDLFLGRIRTDEIEAEAEAQIARIGALGVSLTHVDTHKHTHMFPNVLRPVLRAARATGIRTVRNPFEPAWSIRATPRAPWLRRFQVQLLHNLEPAFRRIVAEEGFVTTEGAIGVLATGTLDAETLTSLVSAMPDGTWELVTHPGYNDTALANAGTRLLASRETEMATLTNAKFPQDIELINFGQLSSRSSP